MRTTLSVLGLLILLIVTGCFDYEETLVFNKDGSGSMQMHYAVDKSYLNQLKTMYEQMAASMPELEIPDDPSETMFNEDHIRQTLAEEQSSVTLDHYRISETETSKVWDMKFSFGDINDLEVLDKALSPPDEYSEQEEQAQEDEEPFLVEQPDGTLLYSRSVSDDEEYEGSGGDDYYSDEEYGNYDEGYDAGSEDEYDDESEPSPLEVDMEQGLDQLTGEMEKMAEGMEDHKIRFVITFPGEIIESNADEVNGNTAVWEYNLGDLQGQVPDQRAVIKP